MKNQLIATSTEGVIIRNLSADTDWFALVDHASGWSLASGVLSVAIIDSEGTFQSLFVNGKQAKLVEGLVS
jgi:hypothetical protein